MKRPPHHGNAAYVSNICLFTSLRAMTNGCVAPGEQLSLLLKFHDDVRRNVREWAYSRKKKKQWEKKRLCSVEARTSVSTAATA